jgi:hypothetical protein
MWKKVVAPLICGRLQNGKFHIRHAKLNRALEIFPSLTVLSIKFFILEQTVQTANRFVNRKIRCIHGAGYCRHGTQRKRKSQLKWSTMHLTARNLRNSGQSEKHPSGNTRWSLCVAFSTSSHRKKNKARGALVLIWNFMWPRSRIPNLTHRVLTFPNADLTNCSPYDRALFIAPDLTCEKSKENHQPRQTAFGLKTEHRSSRTLSNNPSTAILG